MEAAVFSETMPFSKPYGFTFLKTLSLGNLYTIFAGILEENVALTTAKCTREGNVQRTVIMLIHLLLPSRI
jgi:hypothetical protein